MSWEEAGYTSTASKVLEKIRHRIDEARAEGRTALVEELEAAYQRIVQRIEKEKRNADEEGRRS